MQYQKQGDFSQEFEQITPKTDQVSVGKPVIGLPIAQYQLQQVQGTTQLNPGCQQISVDVITNLIYPIVTKEIKLSSRSKYFYCCNCCLGVVVFVMLIARCLVIFDFEDTRMAINLLMLVSDCLIVFAVILGLYAISKYQENLLLKYQVLLGVSCGLDWLAASLQIIISDLKKQGDLDEIRRVRIKILAIIIVGLIYMFFYGIFILWAGSIKSLMGELQQMRNQLENQQPQQTHNNALHQQGTI